MERYFKRKLPEIIDDTNNLREEAIRANVNIVEPKCLKYLIKGPCQPLGH